MKKKKDTIAKKFAEELQIPESAVKNTFRIEMRSTTDMSVEGCAGIVEYDENYISLNLCNCILSIRGIDLEITSFSEMQVLISGSVTDLSFT